MTVWNLFRAMVAAAALALVGCGANLTIESAPNPGVLGQPVVYTVTVENTLSCPLTNPTLEIFVTSALANGELGGFEDLDQFCGLLNDPTEICNFIVAEPDEIEGTEGIASFCCDNETFAQENPEICTTAVSNPPTTVSIREAIIARARALGLPVDKMQSGTLQATTSGGAPLVCMPLFADATGAGFECALDDLPVGGSQVITATFTPTAPGNYYAFALLDGFAECDEGEFLPGGTACLISAVGVATQAPAASGATVIVMLLGLLALGGVALRARRRQG